MNVVLRTLCGCEKIVAAPHSQSVENGIGLVLFKPLPSLGLRDQFDEVVQTKSRLFKHWAFEYHEPSGKKMHVFVETWENAG